MAKSTVEITVNGEKTGPAEVPDGLPMIDYLNDYLGLTGTKFGCGIGVCHACVIIVDQPDGTSQAMRTCINTAASFNGMSLRTVESHAENGEPSPVQNAFLDHFAFQCGYCTSGFVNQATILVEDLAKNPISRDAVEEKIADAMGDHICRCTGYIRYYQAIRDLILADPRLTKQG